MKMINYLLVILLAGAFALAGCGKSGSAPPMGTGVAEGVKKLQATFPSPTLLVQTSLDKVKFLTRQARFEPALVELETMSRIPNLTSEQQQAISGLVEEVKKAMAAAPSKPAP